MSKSKKITIVGAGLVGSLLAILLGKRGYKVTIYERRKDLRKASISAGKSINLALSNRGLKPLEQAGIINQIKKMIIPMKGRMIHDEDNQLTFQRYGKSGQVINSISRGGLNSLLMDVAEQEGAKIYFDHQVNEIDFDDSLVQFHNKNNLRTVSSDIIIGADGAYSAVRSSFQKTDRFDYSQYFISHGYKELYIPPDENGEFMLEKNALHIWPRNEFMLIALPNKDCSFTVTLFLPFEGNVSFAQLSDTDKIDDFFSKYFPDAKSCMKDLTTYWNANPMSSLVTVKSYPWIRNKTMLIGDAAHAIVPFFGQGMNCGFEDCGILEDLLNQFDDNWDIVLPEYQLARKKNTDAIADLAIENYTEMRDLVADKLFLLRKQIEAKIHDLFPDKWIPQYSMVTFNEDISYAEARKIGQKQANIMDEVMKRPNILETWESMNYSEIVNQLTTS